MDIRIKDRDPIRLLQWLCAKLAAAWTGKRDAVPVGMIPGSRIPSPDSRPCMSVRVGSQDADRPPCAPVAVAGEGLASGRHE